MGWIAARPDTGSAATHISVMDRRRTMDRDPAVDPRKLAADEAVVRGGFRRKLRATIGKVPFLEDAVAAFYCAVDRDTPLYVKAVLMGAIAYFITPTDVIPDFIAALGYTDDAAVLMAAIRAIGSNLRPSHRERARRFLAALSETSEP